MLAFFAVLETVSDLVMNQVPTPEAYNVRLVREATSTNIKRSLIKPDEMRIDQMELHETNWEHKAINNQYYNCDMKSNENQMTSNEMAQKSSASKGSEKQRKK